MHEKEKLLEQSKRELARIQAQWEEEKLFIKNKLRQEVEEDKQAAIEAVKERYGNEAGHTRYRTLPCLLLSHTTRKVLKYAHDKEIAELKQKHQKELDQAEEQRQKDIIDAEEKIEAEYEDLLAKERYGTF